MTALLKKRPLAFRLFALTLALVIVAPPSVVEAKGRYSVSARSAIFSNSTQVVRYYGKQVHRQVLPASTTKIMTALLVLENLPLNKKIKFSKRATGAQPSKLYARPGEQFTVEDLLYAILIKSANDASIALAEAVAGSEWKFVQMMNKRARQIGARHTRFANASGLPSKSRQYTTAYDMYLIFREAIKKGFFKDTLKIKYKSIRSTNTGRTFKLKSHNKMLFFKDWEQPLYGKTGYTRAARSCFVGYIMKGNSVCIIAIFGCTRRWSDIKHIVSRYGGIKL